MSRWGFLLNSNPCSLSDVDGVFLTQFLLWYMFLCQISNEGKGYIYDKKYQFACWMGVQIGPVYILDRKRRNRKSRCLQKPKRIEIQRKSVSFAFLFVFSSYWTWHWLDQWWMTNVCSTGSGESSCPVRDPVSVDAEWF